MSTLNYKTFFTPKELLMHVSFTYEDCEDFKRGSDEEFEYSYKKCDLPRDILPKTAAFLFLGYEGKFYVFKDKEKWGINYRKNIESSLDIHYKYNLKNKRFNKSKGGRNILCFNNMFDALQLVYNWLNNIEKPIGI